MTSARGLIINTVLVLLILPGSACSYLPENRNYPDGIIIEEERDIIGIIPQSGAGSATGLVFYPGGLVDPHAYVELLSRFALSGAGHRVIIVKMPSNLAVLASKSARKILRFQEGSSWVIAGHSLGGAMACSLVAAETELFEGMVLMAAYPPSSTDLSNWQGEVLSISATQDRVVDNGKYEAGKDLLPPATGYVVIEGGNHAGFGSYGEQKGDGEAQISRDAQHIQVVEYLQQFYEEKGLE